MSLVHLGTNLEIKFIYICRTVYICKINCKLKIPSQLTTISHSASLTSSSKANEKMKKMQGEINSLKDNTSQVDILKEQVAFLLQMQNSRKISTHCFGSKFQWLDSITQKLDEHRKRSYIALLF
ncbi:unnamed protein product [Trifolium pratense]|uniref:Uncharacterized protein n=1 Tax=Trifolium pratense TaxID=57577 RepID=A0ACB0IS46_TRIPR|nr:unnamed protein product [Trifolium pratense]